MAIKYHPAALVMGGWPCVLGRHAQKILIIIAWAGRAAHAPEYLHLLHQLQKNARQSYIRERLPVLTLISRDASTVLVERKKSSQLFPMYLWCSIIVMNRRLFFVIAFILFLSLSTHLHRADAHCTLLISAHPASIDIIFFRGDFFQFGGSMYVTCIGFYACST